MHAQQHHGPNWLRLADAAARAGLPLSTFRRVVESGSAGIRMTRQGQRGLVFVAEQDVDAYRVAMAAGAIR